MPPMGRIWLATSSSLKYCFEISYHFSPAKEKYNELLLLSNPHLMYQTWWLQSKAWGLDLKNAGWWSGFHIMNTLPLA